MTIPRQLITYLNSGKCFALVGSGPSTAMGYPSWKEMAEQAVAIAGGKTPSPTDARALQSLIAQEDYPEVFERAAHLLGGVQPLLGRLKKSFAPKNEIGKAYEYLARWPFRCYLTTNFDDEIVAHLHRLGQHFTTLRNVQADLAQITSNSSRLLLKLHGDLDTPSDIVLTTSQYTSFETGGARAYFRGKLTSIFQMVPVVVIGHSMSDRNLRLVLQSARESASPEKPTYVIVADALETDITKYQREFNIHLLSYRNPDKTHANLLYTLRQIDRFVIPRTASPKPPLDFPDSKEVETGVSLYVYSSLGYGDDHSLLQRAIRPQVLAFAPKDKPSLLSEIRKQLLPEALRTFSRIDSELDSSVQALASDGLIASSEQGILLNPAGIQRLEEIRKRREIDEDQFFGALRTRLLIAGTKAEIDPLLARVKNALLGVFRKRGLATAEMLFRANPYQPPDMPELFESLFSPAAELQNYNLRTEYCNSVMDVLTKPTVEQRRYLANLAQGFFAYHMFGLDPTGQETRKRLIQDTLWLLDSNILMPLVARRCELHSFMVSLVDRMKAIGIEPATTPAFVAEVEVSLRWVFTQLKNAKGTTEQERFLDIVTRSGYSANPFIDGFIIESESGEWGTFNSYVERLGLTKANSLSSVLNKCGVRVIAPRDECGSEDDLKLVKLLSGEILVERERAGTVRAGEPQTDAEAEALQLIRKVRSAGLKAASNVRKAFFVSTSLLLDRMYKDKDGLLTWFPETLYKHLQFLTSDGIDPQKTFDALATSYYSVGIDLIDADAYCKYFRGPISESTLVLDRELDNYVKGMVTTVEEQQGAKERILKTFAATPDLEKPQFVTQLGWLAARKAEKRAELAEQAKKQAEQRADDKVKVLQDEYARKERERKKHEEGRQRNLRDPDHLRKRLRQAKKRKRKG
jgi:hypothetical protein